MESEWQPITYSCIYPSHSTNIASCTCWITPTQSTNFISIIHAQLNHYSIIIMSVYRQSPSKSPYKPIVKSFLDERLIEDEIALKRGIAQEAEIRRLVDENSILRLKNRKMEELEVKHEALLKQVALITADNDRLLAEIGDRKHEIDRLKLTYAQVHDRESFKATQLSEHNNILKLENEQLHRDKIESGKVYQSHISKLEIVLEEKIKELEIIGVRFNKLLNEKETNEIRFEEEKARLKSEMNRAEHLRQREVEQDRERRFSEKILQIQNMKRNHLSQIALLQDEVKKLSRLSELKSTELQGQILQNRQLKAAHEAETKELLEQNEALRLRMAKLQEHNRSEIQNIEAKYSNMQAQGTITLKEQHGNEVRLLLSELDKLKWLLGEKNLQIQQLTLQKRELKQSAEDQQLQLNSDINLLKSKLVAQQDKYSEDKHNQTSKINTLEERLLRESQNYHERVKGFTSKIEELQAENRKREVAYDKVKKESDFIKEKLLKEKEDLRQELATIRLNLNDNGNELAEERVKAEEYRKKSQQEYQRLARQISELQQQNESLRDELEALRENQNNEKAFLRQQNQSLKRTNEKLEMQFKEFQAKSTLELGDLSQAHRSEMKRIEGILALKLQQATRSFREQKSSLQAQLAMAKKYATDKEQELRNVLERFEELNVHFNNRERLVQYIPKSDASILEAFSEQRNESEFRVYEKD